MNQINRFLTATFFVAVSCAPAMANTISYTHTTAQGLTPFTDSFLLNTFNTSLGILTGVTVSFTYNTTGEVDIDNLTSTPQAFTNATSSVPVTLFAPGSLSSVISATAGPINGTANASTTTSFSGIVGTGTSTITVPTVDFTLYETPPAGSTASFSVVGGSASFSGTAPAGVFFGGGATAGGTTTVTYTYVLAGTPEPATMATMGGALVGLGALLRRRRTMGKQ